MTVNLFCALLLGGFLAAWFDFSPLGCLALGSFFGVLAAVLDDMQGSYEA